MSSCLGLYIENNIIKYAKVSKDRDNIKVDSFGVKFYDNIDTTVKQIINETFSYKIPISVNISDEKYTYANVFSLLNKNDTEKAVSTEFDYFCNENGKNRNALEYRRVLVPNLEDRDKITSIYAYAERSSIIGRLQVLDGYRIGNLIPVPMSISNLNRGNEKNNTVIINIEKNTSLTFLVKGEIHKVEIIDNGMKDILENIMQKENSYAKAYEICKNTTIYTSQAKNLQIEDNEHMEDIMPVLYGIVEKAKEIILASGINVEKIYITGLAAVINNIDLYFQENFLDKKCEVLVPFFIEKSNIKLNIKDYIEVNSAISLGLQGVGIGNKEINFKNKGPFEQLSELLAIDITKKSKDSSNNKENKKNGNVLGKFKISFKGGFNTPLDNIERNMIRTGVGILLLLVMYTVFSNVIINQIRNKDNQILEYIKNGESKIATITKNTILVNERKEQYDSFVERINEQNDILTQNYAKKNVLPNFLTQIMFNIPKEVQLTSISNPTDKDVTIIAQSKEYEQLGYFIAKIKNEGILNDVTATTGEKHNEFIEITINGKLPF
jgi:Tfp pilus assembly protein PilN